MIIDPHKDKEFGFLRDFMLSFEFPNKHVVQNQINNAVIAKECSAYHIAFHFSVDRKEEPLPEECNGILMLIQIKSKSSLTCCELFVANQYVREYRIYNIDASELDVSCITEGKIYIGNQQIC